MEQPEGFIRVRFAVISDDGHRLPAEISCLVCRVCQAMILQNDYGDFVKDHRLWHKHLDELFKAHDAAATEPSLDTQADWEKMDPIQVGKRRR